MFYSAPENHMLQAALLFNVRPGVFLLIFKCGKLRKRASEAQLNALGCYGHKWSPRRSISAVEHKLYKSQWLGGTGALTFRDDKAGTGQDLRLERRNRDNGKEFKLIPNFGFWRRYRRNLIYVFEKHTLKSFMHINVCVHVIDHRYEFWLCIRVYSTILNRELGSCSLLKVTTIVSSTARAETKVPDYCLPACL